MKDLTKIFTLLGLFICAVCFAQVNKNDTIRAENYPKDSVSTEAASKSEVRVLADIDEANRPVAKAKYSPARAGLYSAVLPGLGQYYNRKYWKIPIVWGAVGAGTGIVLWNNRQYKRYRNAFVAELNGQTHEFSDIPGITKESLGRVQDQAKRQRDYAIAITALVYILNIVDAVVDAHLYDQRHDPDLALQPAVIYNEFSKEKPQAGLSLSYKF